MSDKIDVKVRLNGNNVQTGEAYYKDDKSGITLVLRDKEKGLYHFTNIYKQFTIPSNELRSAIISAVNSNFNLRLPSYLSPYWRGKGKTKGGDRCYEEMHSGVSIVITSKGYHFSKNRQDYTPDSNELTWLVQGYNLEFNANLNLPKQSLSQQNNAQYQSNAQYQNNAQHQSQNTSVTSNLRAWKDEETGKLQAEVGRHGERFLDFNIRGYLGTLTVMSNGNYYFEGIIPGEQDYQTLLEQAKNLHHLNLEKCVATVKLVPDNETSVYQLDNAQVTATLLNNIYEYKPDYIAQDIKCAMALAVSNLLKNESENRPKDKSNNKPNPSDSGNKYYNFFSLEDKVSESKSLLSELEDSFSGFINKIGNAIQSFFDYVKSFFTTSRRD